MVTSWENHWNNLSENRTLYTERMLRNGMNISKLKENTETIFIKKNKIDKTVERSWEGKVFGLRRMEYKNKPAVQFNVDIQREIACPEKHSNYSEGWYCEENILVEQEDTDTVFEPSFFKILNTTNSWKDFEEYTFHLLKLLGLHETYKFHYESQAGKADGFFVFKNLAVLFDATLETNFEKSKETQINNYCEQLRSGILKHGINEFKITGYDKQVWIITKSMASRLIKNVSNISVKEVGISNLIQIYRKRLDENLNEAALEKLLREI